MSSAAAGEGALAAPALVSVLIPSYDRPHYLRAALASAVAQTHGNLEIIVHDNASATDPAAIVAAFGDPRIRLYRNARNLGVTGNLAAGLGKCAGKYVAILGDDDLWERGFLATLVAPLERHPEAVASFCDHDIIDEGGVVDGALSDAIARRFGRDGLREGLHRPFGEIALVRRSICVMSGALLRRDAAGWADLPQEVASGTDLYLAYLAARTGGACYYVPLRLMHYRYHRASLTRTFARDTAARVANVRAALYYWNRFCGEAEFAGNRRFFEMKRGGNALRLVLLLLRRGEGRAALAELAGFFARGFLRPGLLLYPFRQR